MSRLTQALDGFLNKGLHLRLKMADGRHFEKNVKSPYICNRLTDFDEIEHVDA